MKHYFISLVGVAVPALVISGLAYLQSPEDRAENLSRIKQVATGMVMYSADWDDQYPYVQDTPSAMAVEYPYIKNMQVFKSLTPGSRFLFNMGIAGVAAVGIEDPSSTIMFYDEKPWVDGKRAVAFVDGHAKYLAPADWSKVKGSLKLKIKRTATSKPLPKGLWQKLWPQVPPPQ